MSIRKERDDARRDLTNVQGDLSIANRLLTTVQGDLEQIVDRMAGTVKRVREDRDKARERELTLRSQIRALEMIAERLRGDEDELGTEIRSIIEPITSKQPGGIYSDVQDTLNSVFGVKIHTIQQDPARPEIALVHGLAEELVNIQLSLHAQHLSIEARLKVLNEHLATAEAENRRLEQHYESVGSDLRRVRRVLEDNFPPEV